ncbi:MULTISPECIES: hypothetical protein [Elizabethkingia]|uniref:HTH cro/C1-type domain-containing protein n=1 Tax=Elizabethkingia anophelis R26 TaxID=1246994 RepID=A0ABM6MRB9_9FLAO|nr:MULTISPECIES: hypothetical protein [Elizabethkingia]ATC35601.1 hypothetical protein BAZ09_004955 [Elizabethkingia anophelis R26]ATC39239.1 hypothetical protein EAAG1_004955 [Elizabethkingia anophelis Ag1]ATC42920.1 hypothetical protein CMV41_04955 [Elizabethkingia anophelis]ATC46596.1 hypothetical protein CMV40_04955 [Elizabethkingia anophelis]ELR81234.1 hypothetical protein D505_00350 [Elizabethkingia anophelis R26]
MKLSKKFKEWLKPDAKKSELCMELNISRSTLSRWISKSPENLSRLDRVEIIKGLSGLSQEEMFEAETITIPDFR